MRYLIACGIMPPELGGPAPVIRRLAGDLKRAGHEATIVTYTPNPDSIEGVRIVTVPRNGLAIGRYLRFTFAVRRLLASADVLLATDVFSVGLPCRLALIGSNATFMLRLGGEWRWEQAVTSGKLHETLRAFWARRPSLRDRFDLARYRWILARASRVMTTSEWLGDILREAFPKLRASFVAVPNVSAIRCAPSAERRPHDPLRLLYVGRFAPVKNVPFFAGVVRELSRRGVRVACTFVGEGETKEACEEILRGVPGVEFAGAVRHDDLKTHLDACDLFVLPSLSDVCPNAVVEALACGIPCVITSEHGLPKPVRGVVELHPNDERAWVEAIASLAHPEAYVEILRAVAPVDLGRFPSLLEAVQRV